LEVEHFLRVLTQLEDPWAERHWIAKKMQDILKGETVNGYFYLTVDKRQKRFDGSNQGEAQDLVCISAGRKLEGKPKPFTIVPIPNSAASIAAAGTYATLRLATAIAGKMTTPQLVVDALRWVRPITSSRAGGSRDPDVLAANLQVVRVPQSPVILLDDVMTTGGHFVAAAQVLRARGVIVRSGIALTRTTWESDAGTLGWQTEILDT